MKIQSGSAVLFDLKGIPTKGRVTLMEGNKATVMYADEGQAAYIDLDIGELTLAV